MLRRDVLKAIAAAGAATAVGTRQAAAQDVIKIGACLSLTGGFQTVARQALAAAIPLSTSLRSMFPSRSF